MVEERNHQEMHRIPDSKDARWPMGSTDMAKTVGLGELDLLTNYSSNANALPACRQKEIQGSPGIDVGRE